MKRAFVLVVAALSAVACSSSNRQTATSPAQVIVTAPRTPALPLPPPPADDPTVEWHTYAPRAIEGTPFYRVVDLNVVAPSLYDGPCRLNVVEGATFLNCGNVVRVDGARIDTSFPSPGSTTSSIFGRWPDDLWASIYQGDLSDGYTPPKDSFRETDYAISHLERGKWVSYPTGRAPVPYVDKSSLLFVMPPVKDANAAARAPSCADYSCYRILPRVITTGKVKPDFSSLADRISWLHHHDENEGVPDDFAFVVDPQGPVWVFMRALDLKAKKKGFGVARWAPETGASFDWLPSSLATKNRLSFTHGVAKDGKVTIEIEGDTSATLAFDGRTFKQTATTPRTDDEPQQNQRFFAEGGALMERLGDGTTRVIEAITDARAIEVVTRSEDDVWVFTTDGVYRTVRPPETLYRTESMGDLHPFPPPHREGESCPHPFVILDATESRHAAALREHTWAWPESVGAVEMDVFDQTVVGVPVPSVAEGEKLLEQEQQDGTRMMEGAPHHLVCARPVGAKPFVAQLDHPEGD